MGVKLKSILIGLTASHILGACGSKSESGGGFTPGKVEDVLSDTQFTGGVVNAAHSDVISATADQGATAAVFFRDDSESESESENDDDSSSVTKSCVASSETKAAVVTSTSNVNRSRTKTSGGGRVTVTSTRTGSGASTRTWTRANGTAVSCNPAGNAAQVDFKNPGGLQLDVTFERSRTDERSFTRAGKTSTFKRSFSGRGSRTITWGANDTTQTGSTTYTRNKTVVIKDTTKSISMTNKNGKSLDASLAISTSADSPLVVKVERDNTTNAVASKTIVSGQVIVKKDSDATITTTYNNLMINFVDGSCSIQGGSAQVVVTDSAGTTLKAFTLGEGTDGDGSLKDDSGAEIEDFDLEECDAEDLKL